jgi:hypothetical protein
MAAMKRWTFGFLALLCSSMAALLGVAASELRAMVGHDASYFAFCLSAVVVFGVSAVLLRFAIKKNAAS